MHDPLWCCADQTYSTVCCILEFYCAIAEVSCAAKHFETKLRIFSFLLPSAPVLPPLVAVQRPCHPPSRSLPLTDIPHSLLRQSARPSHAPFSAPRCSGSSPPVPLDPPPQSRPLSYGFKRVHSMKETSLDNPASQSKSSATHTPNSSRSSAALYDEKNRGNSALSSTSRAIPPGPDSRLRSPSTASNDRFDVRQPCDDVDSSSERFGNDATFSANQAATHALPPVKRSRSYTIDQVSTRPQDSGSSLTCYLVCRCTRRTAPSASRYRCFER